MHGKSFAFASRLLDPDRLLDSARAGIAEGLLAGTTCYADTCDSGVALRAMREAGVRGIMYQEVFGPDPDQAADALGELRQRIAAHRASTDALRAIGVSPHAPYSVSDALFESVARYAEEESLPVAVHIAESAEEVQFVRDAAGPFANGWQQRGLDVSSRARSPVTLLERLGVLGPRTLAVHCVHADSTDITVLAATRTAVAHCPVSNAKLGHGIAPLRGLLAAGVRVGLGSDSMASNNRMHLLEEARIAVLAQHARLRDPCALGAHAALELATIGGARALGLEERIGSLEAGKDADLAAFPLNGAATAAEHDAEAAAVWSLGGARAVMVAVAGTELVSGGELVRQDPALASRTLAAARALAEWNARQGMSSG